MKIIHCKLKIVPCKIKPISYPIIFANLYTSLLNWLHTHYTITHASLLITQIVRRVLIIKY